MHKVFAIVVAFALAAVLPGCSISGALNAAVPTEGLEISRDLAYGPGARNKLDVYAPRSAAAPRPVVVFFYGGSWQGGSKESYLFVAEALASKGFLVVIPDYRVYPEVVFPAFVEDGAAAVAWTRANAARFGGDPRRVFLMGHSAGAHIAAMLAYDPQWLGKEGTNPQALAGFIGLAGPYDFLPLESANLRRIFAPEATIARTQPINFARAGAPPSLLVTGEFDATVSPGNTKRLAARLRAEGVPVTELRYPELNHYTVVGYLAAPLRGGEPVLEDIAIFIDTAGK